MELHLSEQWLAQVVNRPGVALVEGGEWNW